MEGAFVLAEDTIETWAGGTPWILFTTKKGLFEAFRISRNKFHYIFQKVSPAILKDNTGVCSISPDERLAITLSKLRREDYNYTIGEMTGHAESTVSCLIKEVCQAIVEILWEESVTKLFPKRNLFQ